MAALHTFVRRQFARWVRKLVTTPSPNARRSGARLSVEHLENRDVPSVNPIVAENMLPGTSPSIWNIGIYPDTSIEGFATDISVNHGSTVSFKINDPSLAAYHIDIYRVGYYQGDGARRVATISSSQTQRTAQPAPLTNLSVGLVDAGNWSVSASWAVPSTAVSGLYFANLVREDTGGTNEIVFVVRNDSSTSDVLFQTSDETWQAYNRWGGFSLYTAPSTADDVHNPAGLDRAYKVSYDRPFTTRTDTPYGRDFAFGPEFAMIQWMEQNGYDVSYQAGMDTDRYGSEILQHKVFMSVGHDEYWSGNQRLNVEAARDAGVNLMFLSGNTMYWKTRWENSLDSSHTADRTLVCYKETTDGEATDPSGIWTGTFRDPRFRPAGDINELSENAIIGTIFEVNRGPAGDTGTPFQVPSQDANLRIWRNTSVANLQPGQVATIGDIVLGYEWDVDQDNGFRPAGLIDMSSTTQSVPELLNDGYVSDPFGGSGPTPVPTVQPGTATHSLTLYRAKSGALVFSAATVQWSYGLTGYHDGPQTTPSVIMQQATVNMLADMGTQPGSIQAGLIQTAMSTDLTPPASTITAPTGGAKFTAGQTVTITGTASDSGGGVVAGVEVSTDGGATWHKATGTTSWSYVWTPSATGPVTIKSRATDDSANTETPGAGVSVTVSMAATSTTGLVAAYKFNAGSGTTLADSAGSNTGTISNATWSTDGVFGHGSLSFNGNNSWVTVPSSSSLNLTSGMTLEAWVKPTTVGSWEAVLFKEATSDLSYALYASDTSGDPSGWVYSGNASDATSGTAMTPNVWTHLAATFDGTTLSLYVNGHLAATRTLSAPIKTSTGPLRIGGDSIFGEYFEGLISEVRVYNRALNSGEILSDMSTPIGGTPESTPPTISITTPTGTVSGNTTLTVSAADNVGVAGVQYFANGVALAPEISVAPFSFTWNTKTVPNGTYSITARARDAAGNITTSSAVSLTVSNAADTTPPVVHLTGLTANQTVGGSLILSATASDNIAVTGVQFQVGGTNIGAADPSAPYRVLWNTAGWATGTYTVSAIASDAAGNTSTSSVSVFLDATAPTVVAQTPAPGATGIDPTVTPSVTFSKSIRPSTLSFVLTDSSGNPLAATVSYNDSTKTATLRPADILTLNSSYTLTVSGVQDTVGNSLAAPVSWSFVTTNVITGATIWDNTAVPAVASAADNSAVELGVKFQSETAGFITGLRFYKGAGNTGTHVGHLWTSTGNLLGTATFTNETATGWQTVVFSQPIAIAANTTYVASYFAPNGNYALDSNYFATTGVTHEPLQALANGVAGPNGVFNYAANGGFPTGSFQASNYWVDVVFSTTSNDITPPTVITETPAAGAIGVPVGGVVTATFSKSIQANTLSFVLDDASGTAVSATVSYNDNTHTATLAPSAPLDYTKTYTATVSGAKDAAGNVMTSAVSWSFTTTVPVAPGSSQLWDNTAVPAVASAADNGPVELGVKFQTDTPGYITGLRFYKGAGNTGTHVGHLWDNAGNLLGSATFLNESATGWQTVVFSQPIAVAANTTYVASYFAPNGHYAYTTTYFISGVTSGDLRALANGEDGPNGLYKYASAGGFPNAGFQSSNYWVDVVFNTSATDTTPPAVTGQTPAPNATGILISSPVTVSFSEAIRTSTLSFSLMAPDDEGQSTPVAATVTYDPVSQTATLTPSAPLASGQIYTATVSASDMSGNAMAPYSWSFTTSTLVTNLSLWANSAATPDTPSATDNAAVELGVRFFSEVSGVITGLRFYKGAGNTGIHVGHLWDNAGNLLGSATFTNETATGWQTVTFDQPIPVTANTLYVASYFAPNGGYAVSLGGLTAGAVNAYLHATPDGANGGNGLYKYAAAGGFPTGTFRGSNYWVDVAFSQLTPSTTPPTVTAMTPNNGDRGVASSATITTTFSEAVDPNTISVVVKDSHGASVAGNLQYSGATHTATFVPAAPLLPFMTYTVTVSGAKDLNGNVMSAPSTRTFSTRGVWVQATTADFNTGTNNGTTVLGSNGGVQLAPLLNENFAGTSLNAANWTPESWASQGGGPISQTVSNGTLSLGGEAILSTQSYSNTAVTGTISFAAQRFQHFGLATDLNSAAGNYWALFSTGSSTTTLFARVNSNGVATDVPIGAIPVGFHTYRIAPSSSGFDFYIDGVLRTSIAASFQTTVPMRVALSDYLGASGQLLQATNVAFDNYSTTQTGTFTSEIFNAGQTVTWGAMALTDTVPTGTTLTVTVQVGSLQSDGTVLWQVETVRSDGTIVDANGNPVQGQYLQYSVTMTTSDPSQTPTLNSISFSFN
jgi:hypothetical protein